MELKVGRPVLALLGSMLDPETLLEIAADPGLADDVLVEPAKESRARRSAQQVYKSSRVAAAATDGKKKPLSDRKR